MTSSQFLCVAAYRHELHDASCLFVIFLEIYSGESATVIFSIIITNIDSELLSCLAQICHNIKVHSIKVHLIYLETGIPVQQGK